PISRLSTSAFKKGVRFYKGYEFCNVFCTHLFFVKSGNVKRNLYQSLVLIVDGEEPIMGRFIELDTSNLFDSIFGCG
ncbi:hypothetical protein AKJ43_03920, partial [candidate division MSBL1 archaeon SCGC-AAA261D19]